MNASNENTNILTCTNTSTAKTPTTSNEPSYALQLFSFQDFR